MNKGGKYIKKQNMETQVFALYLRTSSGVYALMIYKVGRGEGYIVMEEVFRVTGITEYIKCMG